VTSLAPAERLLQELGITDPKEIDLEAIAFHCGARVRFRKLEGGEARIIGCNDDAVITIDEDRCNARQRFSLAHEIGHWVHHKGERLICRAEDAPPQDKPDKMSAERVADRYAADLLMPRYLFDPAARAYPQLNFQAVRALAVCRTELLR
jgi:Zn-dependent peptidase ImmA (M78 family)